MTEQTTVVHLVRHGEVDNPSGILYGRLPGYHLSAAGLAMAERIAEVLGGNDITYLVSSPLERAQETARPCADKLGLEVVTDERLTEAENAFQGSRFGVGDGSLRNPAAWRYLYNPFRPSWGEPYRKVAARMRAAVEDARDAAAGHQALVVSHQLPIWVFRCSLEGRRLYHDPRRRQCGLASLTSLAYRGDRLLTITYSEPAADLVPTPASRKFTAGA